MKLSDPRDCHHAFALVRKDFCIQCDWELHKGITVLLTRTFSMMTHNEREKLAREFPVMYAGLLEAVRRSTRGMDRDK